MTRRTYGDEDLNMPEGEEIRDGFEPAEVQPTEPPEFAIGEEEEEEMDQPGQSKYGSFNEERNAWDSPGRH